MTKRICYNNHVSVLALLILSGLSGAQDRIDEDADKVKKPCQKLHFIRKARDALSGTLQNAKDATARLVSEAKIFTLAACTAADAATARAYIFLAALATERAKKAHIDAEKSRKLLAQPMAVFQRREGQIEAVLAAQPDTITFPTAPTPGSTQAAQMGSATGKKCDITFKATSTAVPTCMDSDRNKEAIEKTAAKIKTLIKVKLTPDVAFSGGTFKISIAASGTVNDIDQPANTDNDACATTSSGTPNTKAGANHALGILSVQREQTDYTAEETDVVPEVGANDGRCKKDETASTSLHVTQKQMAHAICKWQEATAVAAAEVSGQKIQDLSEQSDAQQLAQLVLTGEIKDDLTDAAKKKLVIDILGDKEKTINDRFLTPLQNKKPSFKVGNKQNDQDIMSLARSPDYANALAFCAYKKQVEAPVSPMQEAQAGGKTADCKATKEDDCTVDKHCEYKDGKCKLKEEVKADNNGKTTNTTGNNSFVIHKVVPLLLAFFIL